MILNEQQQKLALVYVPRVSAAASMLGSSLIITEVLKSKRNRSRFYHRLILALSSVDFIGSSVQSLTTIPIPVESGVFGAKGNQMTCSLQGWVLQFCLAGPFYNAILATFYLLVIKYNWNDAKFRKKERYIHAFPLCCGLVTAFTGLALGLYNNANLWCWIASEPPTCKGSYLNGGVNDCERGNNAWIFRLAFFYAPVWATIFYALVIMISTVRYVRAVENKSRIYNTRYSKPAASTTANTHNPAAMRSSYTRRLAFQSFAYLGAYFFVWTPITILRIFQITGVRIPFFLSFLASFFGPLQGFFNFLVYARPRYLKYKEKNPDWNFIHLSWETFKSTFKRKLTSSSTSSLTYFKHRFSMEEETPQISPSSVEKEIENPIQEQEFDEVFNNEHEQEKEVIENVECAEPFQEITPEKASGLL